jgi:hypothetical protein
MRKRFAFGYFVFAGRARPALLQALAQKVFSYR